MGLTNVGRKLVFVLLILSIVEIAATYWVINASLYQTEALILAFSTCILISIIFISKSMFHGIFVALFPVLVAADALFLGFGILFPLLGTLDLVLMFTVYFLQIRNNGKNKNSP